jgi:hypothetical protein
VLHVLYIYGPFSGKGIFELYLSVLMLIGLASTIGLYWYTFGVIGVLGVVLYLSLIVYIVYKKILLRNMSILKVLLTAVSVMTIAFVIACMFVLPFNYCKNPEAFYEYDEGYTPPILTTLYQDIGLLDQCEDHIYLDW